MAARGRIQDWMAARRGRTPIARRVADGKKLAGPARRDVPNRRDGTGAGPGPLTRCSTAFDELRDFGMA